jgi:hypothetical protein
MDVYCTRCVSVCSHRLDGRLVRVSHRHGQSGGRAASRCVGGAAAQRGGRLPPGHQEDHGSGQSHPERVRERKCGRPLRRNPWSLYWNIVLSKHIRLVSRMLWMASLCKDLSIAELGQRLSTAHSLSVSRVLVDSFFLSNAPGFR